jgi:hypothetical protein
MLRFEQEFWKVSAILIRAALRECKEESVDCGSVFEFYSTAVAGGDLFGWGIGMLLISEPQAYQSHRSCVVAGRRRVTK